jgi:hypothetical protein
VNACSNDEKKLQSVLLLLLVFVICLYLPTLFHYAFADDEIYLAYTNRFLRESDWTELYQLFLKPANPLEFLPLRDFTYWLDFRFYGDDTGGFHATNLVWYAASGLAAFCLFRELILLCRPPWAARATVLSLCGTLLFMVHPAHVEAVAWIASRKDLIAGSLGLFSIALLARALRLGGSPREILLAVLLMVLACFGKASAMTNILVVTVLLGCSPGVSPEVSRTKKRAYLFLFTASIAVVFLIHLKVGESTGIRIENHPGLLAMIERASRIFSTLIGILLFPYPLRFYYDVYQIGDWHWVVTGSAALLLMGSIWSLSHRRSLWAFGVVFSISPLLIYLQLMPFTTWSLASERFVFVSVAGLSLVLIDFLGGIASPKKIGTLVVLIFVPSALTVWSRVGDWEVGRNMLVREYELQPDFHNAIRDRIVFTLLPEKRFVEAEALARKLPRAFAADAFVSLVGAERAYRRMSEADFPPPFEGGKSSARQDFCKSVLELRSAVRNGYGHMPNEPDVSYNNLLRTLEQKLKFSYGDAKRQCPEVGMEKMWPMVSGRGL